MVSSVTVAVCCSVLQCVAEGVFNVERGFLSVADLESTDIRGKFVVSSVAVAVCCSVLQCVAMCCRKCLGC